MGGEPDGFERGARAARAEAQLLVPGGECRGGIVRVERGEGAGEVTERGPLGRRRERWHDLADAEGRRGGLDLEEVGDGVDELGRGGAELGRQREGLEPRGHRLPLRGRHAGGRSLAARGSISRAALIAHLVGAEQSRAEEQRRGFGVGGALAFGNWEGNGSREWSRERVCPLYSNRWGALLQLLMALLEGKRCRPRGLRSRWYYTAGGGTRQAAAPQRDGSGFSDYRQRFGISALFLFFFGGFWCVYSTWTPGLRGVRLCMSVPQW